jgi:hypothetical protein
MNITFKCPKCGWIWHTSEPISQLDCLGCESRVVTEEREKPEPFLRLLRPGEKSVHDAETPATPRIGESCADYRLTPEAIAAIKACVDKCHMTAAQTTTELKRDGLLPVGWTVVDVANYIRDWSLRSDPYSDVRAGGEFNMLDALKERLPAGWSAERFDKLLDDDTAEQSREQHGE